MKLLSVFKNSLNSKVEDISQKRLFWMSYGDQYFFMDFEKVNNILLIGYLLFEPHHEKTNKLRMRNQMRRSASQ